MAARGAMLTLGGQAIKVAVQLGSLVLLSRLLSPEDYGLVAMVAVLVGLAEVFRDFGLVDAAIQHPNLSRQQQSNLFWLNLLLGVSLALVFIAISKPISLVYQDSRVQNLMLLMSVVFVLNGATAQYRALLLRNLRFKSLVVVESVASVSALVIAVALAVWHFGYFALVAQAVFSALFTLVGAVWFAKWLPGPFRRGEPMRRFIQYSWPLATAQVVIYVGRSADIFILGILQGAALTGVYSRSLQLVLLPLNQLTAPLANVTTPVLSRLMDNKIVFDRYLVSGQLALMSVLAPLYAILAAQASFVVPLLLGNRWASAVPVVQLLCISGAARAASVCNYWYALAAGETGTSLRVSLLSAPLLIGGVLVGSLGGIVGVAAGVGISAVLTWMLSTYVYDRLTAAPSYTMFKAGVMLCVIYGLAALASIATGALFHVGSEFARVVMSSGVFLLVAAACCLYEPFRRSFRETLNVVRYAREGRT